MSPMIGCVGRLALTPRDLVDSRPGHGRPSRRGSAVTRGAPKVMVEIVGDESRDHFRVDLIIARSGRCKSVALPALFGPPRGGGPNPARLLVRRLCSHRRRDLLQELGVPNQQRGPGHGSLHLDSCSRPIPSTRAGFRPDHSLWRWEPVQRWRGAQRGRPVRSSAVTLKAMSPISRAFFGRRQRVEDSSRVPPGRTSRGDFPVLSAGPTPYTPKDEWNFTVVGAVESRRAGHGTNSRPCRACRHCRHPLCHQVVEVRQHVVGVLARCDPWALPSRRRPMCWPSAMAATSPICR